MNEGIRKTLDLWNKWTHERASKQISEWMTSSWMDDCRAVFVDWFLYPFACQLIQGFRKGQCSLELHQMILNKRATHIVRHSMPGILHRKPPKLNCVIVKGWRIHWIITPVSFKLFQLAPLWGPGIWPFCSSRCHSNGADFAGTRSKNEAAPSRHLERKMRLHFTQVAERIFCAVVYAVAQRPKVPLSCLICCTNAKIEDFKC